jgi:hypothetical protein
MKRLVAGLIAATTLITLSGVVGPAAAAPSPKVSVRLAISSECVATAHLSWSGIPAEWLNLNLAVTMQGVGTPLQNEVALTTSRGKTVLTYSGTQELETVTNILTVQGGGLMDSASKNAACSWSAS